MPGFSPQSGPRRAATSLGVVAALLLAACAMDTHPGPSRPIIVPSASPGPAGAPSERPWTPDPGALVPERIRIHPLTRMTRDEAGRPQLALHLELKDQFGHSVKALGWLRVELVGARQEGLPEEPAEPGAPDGRAQSVYWEVDLRDPGENALMYDDLVTRTYLIYLGGLPGWAERWAEHLPGGVDEPWLGLNATFVAPEANNRERILRASYRLER